MIAKVVFVTLVSKLMPFQGWKIEDRNKNGDADVICSAQAIFAAAPACLLLIR